MRFSLLQERGALFNYPRSAPIAQLVEQLICNQWVGSSSLSGGTILPKQLTDIPDEIMIRGYHHVTHSVHNSSFWYLLLQP